MKLSADAEKKLEAWLNPETWYKAHDLDMERWYRFVDQYQRDRQAFDLDEAALRDTILAKIRATHPDSSVDEGDPLRTVVRERISLAREILDFLKVRAAVG